MIFTSTKKKLFRKRNLERNVLISITGLHNLLPLNIPKLIYLPLRTLLYIKEYLSFYYFKKISIPQIEFIITTHCTLKCKKCAGYFPILKQSEHFVLSFQEYIYQFNNLINAVDEIKNLIITGGEPLLSPDITQICEYSLKNKKVKKLWIFTNGTIEISDELLCILKKYKKKVCIRISNYSDVDNIKHILKHKEIIDKLKQADCHYIYLKEDRWIDVFDIKDYKRTIEENRQYYIKCLHTCAAVHNGILYTCPRGAIISIMQKIKESPNLINLNKKITKNDIIDFYTQDYFSYCNFCDFVSEREFPSIPAGEQQE